MSSLSTYSPTDSLAVMKKVIPPGPVKFSFDTPGWHILEGILIFILVLFIVYYVVRWYKNAYRREALQVLKEITSLRPADIREVSILLKRVAMTAFPEENPGSLTGEPWYDFLKSKVKRYPVSKDKFMSVMQYSYTVDEKTGTKNLDDKILNEFVEYSTYWIRRHEV